MADYAATMRVYNGSVLEAQLLSSQQTLVLSSFGSSQSITISDANDVLYVGETTVIGGTSYQMLGSGTVQPGASVLGSIVPLGSPRDVLMMRNLTTGNITFMFPDGTPNVLGAVVMVVDVDPIGYNLIIKGPVCFVRGTRILTPDGYRRVEDLRAGDLVTDRDGRAVPVLQVMAQRFGLQFRSRAGLVPVLIEPGAFGAGVPGRQLALSPQHRVVVRGPQIEMWFGEEEALVPVQALIDGVSVRRAEGWAEVCYHHILCVEHVVLVAEGVQAESLLLGPQALTGLGLDVPGEAANLFPGLESDLPGVARRPCLPLLSYREGIVLHRAAGDLVATYGGEEGLAAGAGVNGG
jgi:hypothetical protein